MFFTSIDETSMCTRFVLEAAWKTCFNKATVNGMKRHHVSESAAPHSILQ